MLDALRSSDLSARPEIWRCSDRWTNDQWAQWESSSKWQGNLLEIYWKCSDFFSIGLKLEEYVKETVIGWTSSLIRQWISFNGWNQKRTVWSADPTQQFTAFFFGPDFFGIFLEMYMMRLPNDLSFFIGTSMGRNDPGWFDHVSKDRPKIHQ